MDDGYVVAFGPCVRCRRVFPFDPETVPSVSVNEQTRSCMRPDLTEVVPGEPGTVKEPVCPTCEPVFRRPMPQPLTELFPYLNREALHA